MEIHTNSKNTKERREKKKSKNIDSGLSLFQTQIMPLCNLIWYHHYLLYQQSPFHPWPCCSFNKWFYVFETTSEMSAFGFFPKFAVILLMLNLHSESSNYKTLVTTNKYCSLPSSKKFHSKSIRYAYLSRLWAGSSLCQWNMIHIYWWPSFSLLHHILSWIHNYSLYVLAFQW